jgi:hypothetical protein
MDGWMEGWMAVIYVVWMSNGVEGRKGVIFLKLIFLYSRRAITRSMCDVRLGTGFGGWAIIRSCLLGGWVGISFFCFWEGEGSVCVCVCVLSDGLWI